MSSSTRVYIGRLSGSVRDTDIQKFFRNYGKIREILLKDGYGFVEFDDKRDAEDAVYDMNGKELCGERVIVEHAKPPGSGRGRGSRGGFDRYSAPGRPGGYGVRGGGYAGYRSNSASAERYRPRPPAVPRTEYRIIVDNLSSRTSWQDLKDYMRKGGEVIYADAHKRRPNQGVVEFATSDDMRRAIEKLDGTELSGRRLKIYEDRGHSRSRRRSHSGSSSRSRSRSRSHHSGDRSRSRSPRSRDRSRSGSRDNRNRSRSGSHRNDRSRSQSKGNARSASRSRSRDRNSREKNSRDRNSRDRNSRDRNSRDRNSRDRNSRDRNSRDRNSRDRNSRDRNDSRSPSPEDRSRSRSQDGNAAS